jgi:hypothetical protein
MKTWINAMAGLLISLSLQAQVTTEFYHAFHFNDLNYGEDIIATSDSRLVVIGVTYSFGNMDSYASPLIQLDEQGNLLDTLFLPFRLSTVAETNDSNYLAGGDDFTYKVSPAGDSIWEKPYPAGRYGASVAGIEQLNDSIIMIHSTRYTGENHQDPYAKMMFLDEHGEFISENTLTVWPGVAVDLEKTPDGRGIALGRPQNGNAVFLGEPGGLEKEISIYLGPTDLVIANDSTYFILGGTNNGSGILKTDRLFSVIDYRNDLYPHKFYSGCRINDTLLVLAAQSDDALYLALLDIDLNLLVIDTLPEYAGLRIREIISLSDNRVALTGYSGTTNDSTDIFVLGLAVKTSYQHTPEIPLPEKISVFPNPSRGIFYVDVDDFMKEGTAEIYSLDGRLVQRIMYHSPESIKINLENAAPGVYFLKLSTKVEEKTFKLIKL